MKKVSLCTIALLAFVIGCVTGMAARNVLVPARAADEKGPTYAYEAVNMQEAFGLTGGSAEDHKELLNRFGSQGWRYAGSAGPFIYLERKIPANVGIIPADRTSNP